MATVVGAVAGGVVGVVDGGADSVVDGGADSVVVRSLVAAAVVDAGVDVDTDGDGYVLGASTLLTVVDRDEAVTVALGAILLDAHAEASSSAIATSPTSRSVGAEHARRVVKRCAPTRRVMVLRSS